MLKKIGYVAAIIAAIFSAVDFFESTTFRETLMRLLDEDRAYKNCLLRVGDDLSGYERCEKYLLQ